MSASLSTAPWGLSEEVASPSRPYIPITDAAYIAAAEDLLATRRFALDSIFMDE
jgi:hypothetical protein